MKKLMLIFTAAATLFSMNVFGEASECPKDMKVCPRRDECPQQQKDRKTPPKKHVRDPKVQRKRPPMSPMQHAEMKELFAAVKEYKANPTEENKAKVIALLNKGFDKYLEMSEKRVVEMKEKLEKLEKRNKELKENRDKYIQMHFEKIISFDPEKMPKKTPPRKK